LQVVIHNILKIRQMQFLPLYQNFHELIPIVHKDKKYNSHLEKKHP
jgi:hypothetical protein